MALGMMTNESADRSPAELDLYDQRADAGPEDLILRVEPIGTPSGDWAYRASYPELRDVSATSPKVLDAILEVEAKVRRLREDAG